VAPNGRWYSCDHCRRNSQVRSSLLPQGMASSYIRALLQEHPIHTMALSFLHTPLTVEKWASSYWKIGPGGYCIPSIPLHSLPTYSQMVAGCRALFASYHCQTHIMRNVPHSAAVLCSHILQ
jgi:hypothetical protein